MLKFKTIIFFTLSSIIPVLSFAQKNSIEELRWLLEYSGHIGTHIRIYADLPEHHITMLNELSFAVQTDGSRVWHQLYGYPIVGVSVFYGQLGNPDIFGQNIALIPNITFNMLKRKNCCFQPTIGMGFSYFNSPNDPVTNPENLLVGSNITNASYASLFWVIDVSPRLKTKLGFTYFHCSNGHYQLPNIGLNLPSVSFSIVYYPGNRTPELIRMPDVTRDRKLKFNIQFGMGIQEFGTSTGPVGEKKYPVYEGTIYLSKRFGKISNVHLGISSTHYLKYYDYYLKHEEFIGEEFEKSSIITVFLAHEFLAGHIGFVTQGGINVYVPQHGYNFNIIDDFWMTEGSILDSFIPTKIGFNFYLFDTEKKLSNNISIGLYLRAKFGQADFVESTIGYTF